MVITLGELATRINGKIAGNPNKKISGVAPIENANESEISFLFDARYQKFLSKSQAGAFLLSEQFEDATEPAIVVSNPEEAYVELLSIFSEDNAISAGVHPSAIVGENCEIAKSVAIAGNVVICDNVAIGKNTIIEPNVTIGKNISIENDCRISSSVVIYERVTIGNRVRIHAGTVIGSDGFGFRNINGEIRKVQHLGDVQIGDDVEIGANTTIDRGTVGSTIIGDGCKLDNLIQIAHNVQLGKNCMLAAQVGIAGSTKLGNSVIMGGKSGIAGHLDIGNKVMIATKAGVTHSISDNQFVSGFPAREHTKSKRIDAIISRLPKMITDLREMRKRIEELEKEMHASKSTHN